MRTLLPMGFAISIITAAVCQAEPRTFRKETVSVVERMQLTAPPAPLYEEYGNVVETFAKAEEVLRKGGPAGVATLSANTLSRPPWPES